MSTNVDPRRSIAAWLETEAPVQAPDRLIAASLERVRTTRQRPVFWPARRTSDLDPLAKLAIAAAAVLVVAIVGYNLVPSRGGVGGPTASPSSSATASPSMEPSGLIDVGSSDRPQIGSLESGTYTDYAVNGTDINVRFTVPSGWQWQDEYMAKTSAEPPDGAAIGFWTFDVQVYTDPCRWQGATPVPSTGLTAHDVVVALAEQKARAASAVIERKAPSGGDPWPAWTVELGVPDDLDVSQCDRGEFRSWGPDLNARVHEGPGQRDKVWVVDVGSERLVIDASFYDGTPAATKAEIDAILDSMVVMYPR